MELVTKDTEFDNKLRSRLKIAVVITALIFVVELVGGYLTNSLALMSDSAHVFMDVLALSLSYFAHQISTRPPTETRTYGLHRFEVFASLINGLSLILISLFIIYKAYGRLLDPPEVESVGMLVVAVVGLVVNLVVAFFLQGFAKSDLNIKSAYLHVIGDAAASVGVIAGAIVIYYTGMRAADPIISLAIGVVIIYGAVNIVRESSHVLLEGVPRGLEINDIIKDIKDVSGVTGVHSLHIWSICSNVPALSGHLEIENEWWGREAEVVSTINEKLARNHGIFYTTIQAECRGCDTTELFRRIEHRGNNAHHHHHH